MVNWRDSAVKYETLADPNRNGLRVG